MSLVVKKNKNGLPNMVSRLWDAEKSLLSDFFDFDNRFLKWNGNIEVPAMNVIEKEKDFSIEMAAPGKSKDDFKIEVEEGMLTISCEKKEEKEETTDNYRRHEFSFDYFSRSLVLPDNADGDKITASYKNGILYLTLPKKEEKAEKAKKVVTVA
jgi:HSP20 family protein